MSVRATSLKTNRSVFFAASFSRARSRPRSPWSAAKPTSSCPGVRRSPSVARMSVVGSSSTVQPLRSFGRFVASASAGPIVGDGGGHDHDVRLRAARQRLALELGGGRRLDELDAGRRRRRRGSRRAASRARRARGPRRRARCPCGPTSGCRRSAPRRSARVFRLRRRERASRAAARGRRGDLRRRATISSGSAIRPTPSSPSAVSPSSGPTSTTPRARSSSAFARVAAMRPHARVHRRRDEQRPAVRERRFGEDVVGEPVRELRERVRRARRDEQQVGARQVEVDVLGRRAGARARGTSRR